MHSSFLSAFFSPRSIAVVGASPDENKIGGIIFKNIIGSSARGNVYPVNTHEKQILGIKCFPSIGSLPHVPDLAVIAIHASAVPQAVRECAKKQIPAVIVISAGFRETGVDGAMREQELREIIKGARTRILGPNCMGVLDTYSKLNTLFVPPKKFSVPKKGGLSLISQSGAVGTAILEYMASKNIGISKFVSYGNRADVEESEIVSHLAADKKTKAILCYIEGLKNGRQFYETLKQVKKPVVVLKAGKYEGSAKAAISHTGSMTGDYTVFLAAMRQAGAITAKTIEELADFGKALACYPQVRNKNPRIGIISNGGGFGVMCADMCLGSGMHLAEFSGKTKERIKAVMPDFAEINNPLDLIGDADSSRFEAALDAVLSDKNVDIAAVFLWTLGISLDEKITDILISARKKYRKPFLVGAFGGGYTDSIHKKLEEAGMPTYHTPRRMMKAIKILAKR